MAEIIGATVTRVGETVKLQPGANPLRVTVVTYMVGDNGPFTLELPSGQDTPDNIAALINAKVATIAAIQGNAQ